MIALAEYELMIDPVASKSVRGGTAASAKSDVNVLETLPPENKEIEVELRDTRRMESFKVRAIFSSKPEELPGADILWIIRQDTGRFKEPWAVKIIERFEDEAKEVEAIPRRKLSLGERKGHMLSDLLKERESKMAEKSKNK